MAGTDFKVGSVKLANLEHPIRLALLMGAILFSSGAAMARSGQQVESTARFQQDRAAVRVLRDGVRQDRQVRAYSELVSRGRAAQPALREGLLSEDWKARFLSAVLLARLGPESTDLDRVSRVLVGHLDDNSIRVDALVAGKALLAIGQPARPYIAAAAWHSSGQLAEQCKLLSLSLGRRLGKATQQARERSALDQLKWGLRWNGKGPAIAPALSARLPSAAERLNQLYVDLGHDQRRGNAVLAYTYFLPSLGRNSQAQEPMKLLLLRKGLTDTDRQRRLMCAVLLMLRDVDPTPELLGVAMESLKSDEFSLKNSFLVANANRAQTYLMRHPKAAQPFLMRSLTASSLSQRIRAAAILAQNRSEPTSAYVPMLLEHLCDNNVANDATLAGFSLSYLGPRVLPWLDAPAKDAQQAHYMKTVRRSVHMLEKDPHARIPFSYSGMSSFEPPAALNN